MKRTIAFILSAVMLFCTIGCAAAESETWECPNCGRECTDQFCPACGTKRPEEPESPAETAPDEEATDEIRLDLAVQFEKNSYFSRYDVRLFVDDEWAATLRHGTDFEQTFYLAPGKHYLVFREDGSSSPAEGSAVIHLKDPSRYSCTIHTALSEIRISEEMQTPVSPDQPELGGEKQEIEADGDLRLQLHIEFKKNAVFSTYDVDMYLDDLFIATLPHGKNFDGVLLVSEGKHLLIFYKSGGKTQRGAAEIRAEGDTQYSCRIEATRNGIKIK